MSNAEGLYGHDRIRNYTKQKGIKEGVVMRPEMLTLKQRKRLRKKVNQHADTRA